MQHRLHHHSLITSAASNAPAGCRREESNALPVANACRSGPGDQRPVDLFQGIDRGGGSGGRVAYRDRLGAADATASLARSSRHRLAIGGGTTQAGLAQAFVAVSRYDASSLA